MSIKRSLIKNTGFNMAGYIYLLLASFFSISILLGNLGSNVFGIYIFLASIIPLASVFDFGISGAVVRRLSLPNISREEKINTWKTSFSLFLKISAGLTLVVFVLLFYLTRTLPIFANIDMSILNQCVAILTVTVFINQVNSHFFKPSSSRTEI